MFITIEDRIHFIMDKWGSPREEAEKYIGIRKGCITRSEFNEFVDAELKKWKIYNYYELNV